MHVLIFIIVIIITCIHYNNYYFHSKKYNKNLASYVAFSLIIIINRFYLHTKSNKEINTYSIFIRNVTTVHLEFSIFYCIVHSNTSQCKCIKYVL